MSEAPIESSSTDSPRRSFGGRVTVTPLRTPARRAAGSEPLRVLLLDEDWTQTLHIAHALAGFGCHVDILTSAPSHECVPYDSGLVRQRPAPPVSDADYMPYLDEVIARAGYDVVYPQTEAIMWRLWDAPPAWAHLIFPRTDAQQQRLLRDKRRMSEYLTPFGVRSPRIMPANDADAVKSAIRELGTPIVVKGIETEGGGIGVRIADDEAAALAAVEELRLATGRAPFLQRFIDGPTFLAGGLFLDGEPVRLYAGQMLETYPPRTGPSTRHRTTRAPDLLRQVVAAMKALRWTGLAEGDFLRDADGNFYFMEINPRAWGSIPIARHAGADLFTPLHQILRGESPAPDLRYQDDVDAVVFPQRCLALLRSQGYTVRTWLRILADPRSWTSVPWTRPRLLLHLLHWVRVRFHERRKRNSRSATHG